MKKGLWLVVPLALVMVVGSLVGCASGVVPAAGSGAESLNLGSLSLQNSGIWVNGTGSVTVVPDLATLSLGVEARAATVEEAQGQAAQAMDAIMRALEEEGVARKDIQTQFYSIQPVQEWDKETGELVIVGYSVSNMVTAKIRNMENVGNIIDAASAAGGDFTRINGLSFSIENPEEYYALARGKAVNDAAAKAEQLASLAGVALGKATYINESSGSIPVYYYKADRAQDGEMPTPISPGEMEVTISVQVIYAIAD